MRFSSRVRFTKSYAKGLPVMSKIAKNGLFLGLISWVKASNSVKLLKLKSHNFMEEVIIVPFIAPESLLCEAINSFKEGKI